MAWAAVGRDPERQPPRFFLVISSTFLRYNQGNRLDNQGQYQPLGPRGSWLFCASSIYDPVKCHIPSSLKTFCPYYFSTEPKIFCLAFKTLHDLNPSLFSPRLTHWASWHSPNIPAALYLLTHCSLSPECPSPIFLEDSFSSSNMRRAAS